ncbi:hypothetical protein WMY93_015991 [Mugilogobius chulae]|uniref:C-type lectin domain-containing protein n=1 Tax=Mugilogobius chulae TaxID=88201 RepID=A0AAW0P1T5_9GOBI
MTFEEAKSFCHTNKARLMNFMAYLGIVAEVYSVVQEKRIENFHAAWFPEPSKGFAEKVKTQPFKFRQCSEAYAKGDCVEIRFQRRVCWAEADCNRRIHGVCKK